MSRKGKVLVAMSGGIDSTITALMLNDEGYEVVGITMKTWEPLIPVCFAIRILYGEHY